MNNQDKKISGYRDLTQDEINAANCIKTFEADLGVLLENVDNVAIAAGDGEARRWVSIARTHLETGMMFAIKAVTRPTNGLGRRIPD